MKLKWHVSFTKTLGLLGHWFDLLTLDLDLDLRLVFTMDRGCLKRHVPWRIQIINLSLEGLAIDMYSYIVSIVYLFVPSDLNGYFDIRVVMMEGVILELLRMKSSSH